MGEVYCNKAGVPFTVKPHKWRRPHAVFGVPVRRKRSDLASKTTRDRQDLCHCFKYVATALGVKPEKAQQLPKTFLTVKGLFDMFRLSWDSSESWIFQGQKHSHVPKFGNWEKDNIPYTTYFENARKEKAGMRMNPNDPEENPEAFIYGRGDLEGDGDSRPVQTPVYVDSDKYISVEKHNILGHNPQGRQKSVRSESGSDKSHSDYSHPQPGHRPLKSDRKKGPGEGSNSFSPPVQGHTRQRSGSYPSDETVNFLF
ncbi:hypothetical protein Patl1_09832 [Pistacia atlantica]|uniref:Uncharacterized protein n=1 Tax=Pistacia atlantica TaxID=434234 RepID=A0ACC1A7Y8_9ROSI|nr:hypothetical protein Patl1_09832 [Pistacia atlantica]